MKKTIHADGFEGWAKRARVTTQKMDRGERIIPSHSITFESPMDIFQVLTVERIRLCLMARSKPHSVTELATALKRDTKSVRRDVSKLVEFGVLRTREQINPGHGRVKIVEAVSKSVVIKTTF